jgi:hypothetical protein
MEKLEIDQQLRSIHNSNLTSAPTFPPPRRVDRYLFVGFIIRFLNILKILQIIVGDIVLNQIVEEIVIVET